MSFRDFKAGLQNVNDYLDARHHISGTASSGTGPVRIAASAQYSFTLREILCQTLSGNGLKMPNLQICLYANINALLGIPNLQAELYDALNQLQGSLQQFMDHTKFDEVLGRLNGVLAEAQQVANLINFCAQPVDPIAIPNMLERAFGSFLGAGKSIVDDIGSIFPDQVCACLGTGGFNANVFNGGVLGRIANNIGAITSGSLLQSELDAIKNDIIGIGDRITNLINFENNISGAYSLGGSQFGTPDSGCNGEIGVLHNPNTGGVSGNARLASQLKGVYDNLADYPVQYSYNSSYDSDGNRVMDGDVIEYPNIFHLLLDDEMLNLLDNLDNPLPPVDTQTPVYDYCGNIIGYTTTQQQSEEQKSEGSVPTVPNSPGYAAGGLVTDVGNIAGTNSTVGNTTVINNFGGSSSTLYIVSGEVSQLALSPNTDDIVVRTDILTIFVRKDTATFNTGTMLDYEQATSTLFEFLNNLNLESGDGLIVKDSGVSRARAVEGKAGETQVVNGDGKAGNIRVELAENTRIPGTAAVKIPVGNTAQRPNTEVGEIRYNSDSNRIEAYFGDTSTWKNLATLNDLSSNTASVSNVGAGAQVFKQLAGTVSELRSITSIGGITVTQNTDDIQIGDQITSSNVGGGVEVFKQRNTNNFEFKTLVSSDNSITFTQNTDTVDISGDPNVKKTTVATSGSSAVAIQVNGAYPEPAVGKTWFFTAYAIGGSVAGQKQAFKIEGLVDNSTGTPSIVGNTIMKTDYQRSTADVVQAVWDPMVSYNTSDLVEYDGNIWEATTAISGGALPPDQNSDWTLFYSGWNFTAEIDGGAFRVKVKGDTSSNVNWDVRFTYLEV